MKQGEGRGGGRTEDGGERREEGRERRGACASRLKSDVGEIAARPSVAETIRRVRVRKRPRRGEGGDGREGLW